MRRMFTEKQVKKLAKEQIEVQVPEMIQADKDILSQIVYDEENDSIVFPKGVLPLKIKADNNIYYFNYADTQDALLVADDGTPVGSPWWYEDGSLSIENLALGIEEISEIEYILSNELEENEINTYSLYHLESVAKPIYFHPIVCRIELSNTTIQFSCILFTNSASQFTWETFKQWLANLYTEITSLVRITTNGAIYNKQQEKYYPLTYFGYSASEKNFFSIAGNLNESYSVELQNDWNNIVPTQFQDGVNRIN